MKTEQATVTVPVQEHALCDREVSKHTYNVSICKSLCMQTLLCVVICAACRPYVLRVCVTLGVYHCCVRILHHHLVYTMNIEQCFYGCILTALMSN
jgi:hypothetical protein